MLQVANAQQEEGHVEGEKEQEEGDRRLQRADEEDRGEDEPALESIVSCGSRKASARICKLTIKNKPNEL